MPRRFVLTLDRPQTWAGGLAVIEASPPTPGLAELHADQGRRLLPLGLPGPEARALRPHVTLARAAAGARPPPVSAAIAWPVHEVLLVQSTPAYRVLARFALA